MSIFFYCRHGHRHGSEVSPGSQDPQEKRGLDFRVGEEGQDGRDKLDCACSGGRRRPFRLEPEVSRASSRSPPIEDLALEAHPEGAPEAEGRRRKKTLAWKSRSCKATVEGTNGSEEDLGENPFNNRDLIKRLVEG